MSKVTWRLRVGERRARRHATFIRALPSESKLEMHLWTRRDGANHLPSLRHCFTAACMAGWLPASFPRYWHFVNGLPKLRVADAVSVAPDVARFFRCTVLRAYQLCSPKPGNLTRAEVAGNLERLADDLAREAVQLDKRARLCDSCEGEESQR